MAYRLLRWRVIEANNDTSFARPSLVTGALFGALWTAALIAISGVSGAILGAPNAAYLTFEAMVRWLPDVAASAAVTAVAHVLEWLAPGSTSTPGITEKFLAVTLTLAIGALIGLGLAVIGRGRPRAPNLGGLTAGILAAVILWLLPPAFTAESLGGILLLDLELVVWGVAIGASISVTASRDDLIERRRVVALLAITAMTLSALGSLVMRLLEHPR